MRRLVLPCLPLLLACQPALKSVPPPAVKLDAVSFDAVAQATQECEDLRARPLSWVDEVTLGARQAMELLDVAARTRLAPDGTHALEAPWLGMSDDELVPITENVNLLGRGLAASSKRPELPWVFVVVDLKRPILFASAGGYVFVTTGLLARVENEAQLATLLALGVARASGRQPVAQLQDARYLTCMSVLMSPALHEVLVDVRAQLGPLVTRIPKELEGPLRLKLKGVAQWTLFTPWTDEEVADAVRLTAFAGYQPLEVTRLLDLIADDGSAAPGGLALAERIRQAAQAFQKDFHLVTPPSKAADLVFRKVSALQPKTMP